MEIVIILLISILIGLSGILVWRTSRKDVDRDIIESTINRHFIDFSDKISRAMNDTRKEVESSKNVISSHALDTLKNINSMNKTINDLVSQQEKAQELGQSLQYLLQTPKLRGNYGEAVLEEMLERILPHGIWERQYAIEGNERVDAVVKYKNVIIPIDAKFPRDDYQKYLSCPDESEKKKHWANYEKALKVQINSIREKYIKPEKGTSEFGLLFIPSESIYYETIAETNYLGDPSSIYKYAEQKKVVPVSPNTFYAFLNVVMLGIRNIEIARDAKKLQEALSRIAKDFDLFYKKFEYIGKTLDSASNAYKTGDNHVKRFRKGLESTIKLEKRFQEEIDAGDRPATELPE